MSPWASISNETPFDPSNLKDCSIKTRLELDRAEAISIRKAHVKYLTKRPSRKTAPFTYTWLLHLHEEMFDSVWKWAGQIRTRNLNLGVDWRQISEQLPALLEDLHCWEKSATCSVIEQSALLHYRAVWIHPFLGGNGRWSRVLANIWLSQHSNPLVYWPDEQIKNNESPIRGDYINALHAADHGDFRPLVALHERYSRPTKTGRPR